MQTLKGVENLTSTISRSKKVSLFDYLGIPAGKELGKKVWKTSQFLNIPTEKKYIETNMYSGKVTKYPIMFLDIYFFISREKVNLKESNKNINKTTYFYI